MLNYGKKFSNFCFLDNHEYDFDRSLECIGGFGMTRSITAGGANSFSSLDTFFRGEKDWVFGHLAYDLKNQAGDLTSSHPDGIGFPDFHFFVPDLVFILTKETVAIGVYPPHRAADIFESVLAAIPGDAGFPAPELVSRLSRAQYLATVKKLQQHILRGDCYEICFCQEWYADNTAVDPVRVYRRLSELSPNPFSALYRSGEKYLMCASPERFLKKTGKALISQPIKGTSKRTGSGDEKEKRSLLLDRKERSENIMIVDLVRNDLSKICEEGSVSVKEFLKIYSFPQVHQMISTIAGTLRKEVPFSEIIQAAFPMGSMTGAPKKRAMELIEQYEEIKRGLFSGSVGYINPDGDFDFNVVIRSILYNQARQYISVPAGSAITWKSIPEKEYEECILKMALMKKALAAD